MKRSFWASLLCAALFAMVSSSLATAGACPTRQYEKAYITGGMNIRASASTNSSVVASAKPGDEFTVLESRAGATWCWLRISLGWLADTSRVQSTRPVQRDVMPPLAPQPAPQSDIDNCCFLDRQCGTNEEWEDGYWAFQNNECSAPTEPPVSNVAAPPQQTTAAPSEVNNCCHIGWECQTEEEWKQGYAAYQIDQCENPGVVVIGSEAFKKTIFDALQILKSRSAYWYAYTVDGLDNIREAPGSRVSVTTRSADVAWGEGRRSVTSRDLGAVAATLVHEACHVHRRRAGLQAGGLVGERACLQIEIQVLDVLGASPGRRNWLQEVLDNINNRPYQWWH